MTKTEILYGTIKRHIIRYFFTKNKKTGKKGINWENVITVYLLFLLAVESGAYFYAKNHYQNRKTGVTYTRTRDTSMSTKIEQKDIQYHPRYYGKPATRSLA